MQFILFVNVTKQIKLKDLFHILNIIVCALPQTFYLFLCVVCVLYISALLIFP